MMITLQIYSRLCDPSFRKWQTSGWTLISEAVSPEADPRKNIDNSADNSDIYVHKD